MGVNERGGGEGTKLGSCKKKVERKDALNQIFLWALR
jgi:hypothetical protein